jgi:hypothetical protein
MAFIRFVFKKKSGSSTVVDVDREEHDRLMEILDSFRPSKDPYNMAGKPVCGLMLITTADNDAMFINLAEIEDVSVIYPR